MSSTDGLGIPDRGSARRSDPQTAKDAASMVRPGSQRRSLLEIHLRAPMGLTDEEAARAAGIPLTAEYATRCSELVRHGLLEDTNQSRAGEAGMQRMVRRITDLGRAALGYKGVSPLREEQCSCGQGPVGHTDTHSSTDRPGIVRISREGKTDQYMNVAATRAQTAQARATQAREDENTRLKTTPRIDPRTHRLTFGGPVLCRRCGGTGGTLWEECIRCAGTGLT